MKAKQVEPSRNLRDLMKDNDKAQAAYKKLNDAVREWLNLWAGLEERGRLEVYEEIKRQA